VGDGWLLAEFGVRCVRVDDIRYVVLCGREAVRVGGRMGGEVGDEAMEEFDVAIAVSGGVVGSWRWCECWRLWWWGAVVEVDECDYALVTDIAVHLVVDIRVSV
jgi:hypothetical protein